MGTPCLELLQLLRHLPRCAEVEKLFVTSAAGEVSGSSVEWYVLSEKSRSWAYVVVYLFAVGPTVCMRFAFVRQVLQRRIDVLIEPCALV